MVTKLILDLDGVLITSPSWKPGEIDVDGYSKFNENCVNNLNVLLRQFDIEIWLMSTRRMMKSLGEFNIIFKNRKIINEIVGFVPLCRECTNRQEEVIQFVRNEGLTNYLILDDDKSLNGLFPEMKSRLVLTDFLKGFDSEKLDEAIGVLK